MIQLKPSVWLQGVQLQLIFLSKVWLLGGTGWKYFEEAFCSHKSWLKWHSFNGVSSHSSHCSGGLLQNPQYPRGSQMWSARPQNHGVKTPYHYIYVLFFSTEQDGRFRTMVLTECRPWFRTMGLRRWEPSGHRWSLCFLWQRSLRCLFVFGHRWWEIDSDMPLR